MPRLSSKAKSQVYSNLEKYARSGMGMDKACESLLSQPRVPGAERTIYLGLLEGLEANETIGRSMARAGVVVTNLEKEVITAAETGGMLEKGFSLLSEYFKRIDKTTRRIRQGLNYPLVVLHLGLPVTVFCAAAMRRADPQLTSQPSWNEVLWDSGKCVLLIYFACLFCLLLGVWVFKMAKRSPAIDAILGRIPLVGKTRRYVAMERFCRVFEIFLLAGLKMSDSLAGAGRASGSALIRSAAYKGSRKISEGGTLSEAIFSQRKAFANDFSRGVAAAEESGQLDAEMGRWGNFYSESAAEAMDSLAEWTPKLFYWIVLLAVAVMVIRAGMAYIGILEGLLNYEF